MLHPSPFFFASAIVQVNKCICDGPRVDLLKVRCWPRAKTTSGTTSTKVLWVQYPLWGSARSRSLPTTPSLSFLSSHRMLRASIKFPRHQSPPNIWGCLQNWHQKISWTSFPTLLYYIHAVYPISAQSVSGIFWESPNSAPARRNGTPSPALPLLSPGPRLVGPHYAAACVA